MSSTAAASAPTRVRYKVVGFCVALAAVTYLDRVCISILAKDISRDLGLSQLQMSYVFSAFTLAYAVFEIPTAWWGEQVGTRRVLTRIVAWWSAFTIATAGAFNYASLLAIRFLFGAGEAGAWPNAARTFARWIPAHERGRVQGIFFMGAHLTGGVTPMIVLWLLNYVHWRTIFVMFGCVGFVWAAAWHRWFRDEPEEHPSTNEAEAALISGGRVEDHGHHGSGSLWRRMATDRNVILLCLMYFSNTYGFYFLITWLPTYLEKQRGFSAAALGFFAGLPLVLSVFGDLFGGIATDSLTRRFGLRIGRATIGFGAYALAGAAMLASPLTSNSVGAAVLIAIAAAASMFTLAASWAACIDVGGAHSGVVSAAMNSLGQVGGVMSPIVLTWLVQSTSTWTPPFYVMGGLYLFSALCWLFIDPSKKLRQDV